MEPPELPHIGSKGIVEQLSHWQVLHLVMGKLTPTAAGSDFCPGYRLRGVCFLTQGRGSAELCWRRDLSLQMKMSLRVLERLDTNAVRPGILHASLLSDLIPDSTQTPFPLEMRTTLGKLPEPNGLPEDSAEFYFLKGFKTSSFYFCVKA